MSSNQHGHTHGHTHGHNTCSSSNSNPVNNFPVSTPTTITATSVSNNNNLTSDIINSMEDAYGWNDNDSVIQKVTDKAAGAMFRNNGVVPYAGFNR